MYIHPFADPEDLFGNYRAAIKLANAGITVKIRPHIDANVLTEWKNPEYEIDGIFTERKAVKTINNFNTSFREAKKQCLNKKTNPKGTKYNVVFDLTNIKNPNFNYLINELNRNITDKRGKYIDKIHIIYNNKVAVLTREEIVKRDYTKLLKIK